jgi:hypothetical protein
MGISTHMCMSVAILTCGENYSYNSNYMHFPLFYIFDSDGYICLHMFTYAPFPLYLILPENGLLKQKHLKEP